MPETCRDRPAGLAVTGRAPAVPGEPLALLRAPLTVLFVGYLALTGAFVALFAGRIEGAAGLLAGLGGCALLMAGCAALAGRRPESRWRAALWIFCPLALQPFLYTSAERYATAPHGRYVDQEMIEWERFAFGALPNLVVDRFATPPLTELMMTGYFSYYLVVSVPALWLLAGGRIRQAARVMFAQVLAHLLCYPGYLLVPLRGPAHALPFDVPQLTGYAMTGVQSRIMTLDPLGTCFPSSHVAMSWAALLVLRGPATRRLFLVLLPFVCVLSVAVVYCRYHYLSDAVAGLVVALAAAGIARRVEPLRGVPVASAIRT
ncbi:phosphatase PAP2 family protein [Nonomuraea sp. NPDC002799]